MTDPADFPEPEPELEPHRDKFLSMSTVLRNLPYLAVLALAIFGVAYSNFSGHPINGYWEFLAIATGLLCIFLRWPNVPERESRLKLVWTQVAHWAAVIVAMNLVLLQGFQQLMPVQAAGQHQQQRSLFEPCHRRNGKRHGEAEKTDPEREQADSGEKGPEPEQQHQHQAGGLHRHQLLKAL
jgi:hypothetical protein